MRTKLDGGTSSSIWTDAELPNFDGKPEAETDVCIIGAGIAGLTTAFELARRGVRLTVLDDGPIGGGETGRTSAHLASAVDDRYYRLEQLFGTGGAQLVAESHATAIDYIEAMVRARRIDCDFRRVDGYLINPPGHRIDDHRELEREMAAAQRAGLECELVDEAPLSFDTGPALRFARQAEFHPLKYLSALAEAVIEMGGKIHTDVRVLGIEPGEPLRLQLEHGRTMICRAAVDATNGAFTSMLHLPLRQAAYRSYCVAFAIPHDMLPHALVWDTADPYHYMRVARGDHGGEVLIVGGGDHRVGQGDPSAQWAELEKWTRQWIPAAGPVVARWSGQIIEPADGLAHIGRSPDLDHVFVISGDSGNGLTHGTIAGLIIPEMMHGKHPHWAPVYDPKRSHLHAAGTLLREAVTSSAPYTDWLRPGDVRDLENIQPGEGAVIRRGLHLIAAYCDPTGHHHLRSATCPHLRGAVHWNSAEKTWDCPCHGSRFDPYGRAINGPAAQDLSPLEVPADKPRERDTQRTPISALPMERER
jgi:glycine/D-amino acid oxidase-like deaminating enzyme/nitrite reductase/ring-hydroxylating ferredoxin subunit